MQTDEGVSLMTSSPKRPWFRFHLSTTVLAMLLLATAVQLNLSGKFVPMGIFVYDEWDGALRKAAIATE